MTRFGGRPSVGAVIAKDFCTYEIKVLRQDWILGDHARDAVGGVIGVGFDTGDVCPMAFADGVFSRTLAAPPGKAGHWT
jgi:hypothetical protein